MRITTIQTVKCLAFAFIMAATTLSQAAHVNWMSDVESGLQKANQSGQLVLLKFTADWCGYCKKMERETFTRPEVAELVNQNFVPVLVDADKYQQLVKHLKIKGLPATLIVSPEMVILEQISGYQTAGKLLPVLKTTLAKNRSAQTQPQSVAATSGYTPAPTRPVSRQTVSATTSQGGAVPDPFTVAEKTSQPAALDKPSFGGLCLPGVNETRSLINGMPQFAMKYRGKTLYFSSAEQMQKFKNQPARYWPMKDGACPVTLAESGQVTEGRLEYAAMFRSKLWFTSSPQQMKKFVASPARYVDALQSR